MPNIESSRAELIKAIDTELQLCDWLLAHAVERFNDISTRVVRPEVEHKRAAYLERLNEEITCIASRAEVLEAERNGVAATN